MKFIITEEQDNRLHILRRAGIIEKCMDWGIEKVNAVHAEFKKYKDYVNAVLWATLNKYEIDYEDIDYDEEQELLDEYFKLAKVVFKDKIRNGYKKYLDTPHPSKEELRKILRKYRSNT